MEINCPTMVFKVSTYNNNNILMTYYFRHNIWIEKVNLIISKVVIYTYFLYLSNTEYSVQAHPCFSKNSQKYGRYSKLNLILLRISEEPQKQYFQYFRVKFQRI